MLQWKNNKYYILWVCVCSLRHPACNVHCHLWPARLYNIFQHYFKKRQELKRKKTFEYKTCVLIFSTTFVWNISRNKWERYNQKCIFVFMQSTRYSCQISIKYEFYRHIFFSKNTQISNLVKNYRVWAELFYEDRQTWS